MHEMNRLSPRHLRLTIYCIFFALVAGCKHPVQVSAPVLPPVPAGPSEYELAYQSRIERLFAWHNAGEDSYQRAVLNFIPKSGGPKRRRTSCDAPLHLAESLYFLAQQQKLNWEVSTEPFLKPTPSSISKDGALDCSSFDSYLTRLRTLKGTFTGVRRADSVAMIHHAIDVEPGRSHEIG